MVKHGFASVMTMTALLLSAAAASANDSASGSRDLPDAPPASQPAAPAVKAKDPRESVGDAFVVQGALRVYLTRPALITLHDARGQQLFQVESSRPVETLPLAGVPTGFLYLTLRSGPLEIAKKIVYSGK